MVFRHYTSNAGVQLAADVVSLGVMLPAATFFLTGQPSGPDFVIPLVVIYSYVSFGVYCRSARHFLSSEHFVLRFATRRLTSKIPSLLFLALLRSQLRSRYKILVRN